MSQTIGREPEDSQQRLVNLQRDLHNRQGESLGGDRGADLTLHFFRGFCPPLFDFGGDGFFFLGLGFLKGFTGRNR